MHCGACAGAAQRNSGKRSGVALVSADTPGWPRFRRHRRTRHAPWPAGAYEICNCTRSGYRQLQVTFPPVVNTSQQRERTSGARAPRTHFFPSVPTARKNFISERVGERERERGSVTIPLATIISQLITRWTITRGNKINFLRVCFTAIEISCR